MRYKRDASKPNRNHWDIGQSHSCFTQSSGRRKVLNRLLSGFTQKEARQLERFLQRMLENA
jgi:hypothetical protein